MKSFRQYLNSFLTENSKKEAFDPAQQDADYMAAVNAATQARNEIIDRFNAENVFIFRDLVQSFGQPPTAGDIQNDDTDDEQTQFASWKYRYGEAAGYFVTRNRTRKENGQWGQWSKWEAFSPKFDRPTDTFETADEAIAWLRTAPIMDAGNQVALAKTYESDRNRALATFELLNKLAVPSGWTLVNAQDSQFGSKYWNLVASDGTKYKLSVRSHEPSPKWQAELGAIDYYVPLRWDKGDAIKTVPLEDISEAMSKLEDWLRSKA
jgi:hypothetical protein